MWARMRGRHALCIPPEYPPAITGFDGARRPCRLDRHGSERRKRMRNRIGLALAVPLIALIFAAAGPASAAPEQRAASPAERVEHRAKSKQRVEHLARYDRQRKMSHANLHREARPAEQRARRTARADQNRYRHHHHMRGPAYSQGGKIRGQNRSPDAWRNIYKRPGQAERMRRSNSGKHQMHRHGWSDWNRFGQPGYRHGQNKRVWDGEHRMKGARGTL